MRFALLEPVHGQIVNRVAAGNCGSTSECIRDRVRRDQDEQAWKRLRNLIEEGLASGPGGVTRTSPRSWATVSP